MFSYPTTEPFNFLGLGNQTYGKAKVVILPVPYSSTTYWKSGTKEGPRAIIEASRHIELYDHETKRDLSTVGIFTLEELEPSKASPEETIARVKKVILQILKDGKLPLMLGGEHSLANGAVQAFFERYGKNFSVLHIDAHTDSRYEFEGTKWHHGCVMRRVRELGISVTSVGIRSVSEEEANYFKKEKISTIFYAPEVPVEKILATLKEKVYITFDLDGLDPSIMPSTGTPEPGGITWYDALNLLRRLGEERKVIGADVVEHCPIPGLHAPDFLAAKLVYKMLQYCFLS
jgi:agmatinase